MTAPESVATVYDGGMTKKPPVERGSIQTTTENIALIRKAAAIIAKEKGLDSLSLSVIVGVLAREAIERREKRK